MNGVAMPMKTGLVVVSTKLNSGEEISQEYPITYPDGAKTSDILAAAFRLFSQVGGIVVERLEKNEWIFYPVSQMATAVKFEIQTVIIADASVRRRGPQLIQ